MASITSSYESYTMLDLHVQFSLVAAGASDFLNKMPILHLNTALLLSNDTFTSSQ